MTTHFTHKVSWRTWFRMHLKVAVGMIPVSILIAVESREMYYRATWEPSPVALSKYRTGDVIAIANRWYTLPEWRYKLKSLVCKAVFKSCWDDLGVIVVRDGTPYIVKAEYDCVLDMPLETFLEQRKPRGAALRRLEVEPGFQVPTTEIAEIFLAEVAKIPVSPWFVLRASYRSGPERRYYEYVTEFNELKRKYRAAMRASKAPAAADSVVGGIIAAPKKDGRLSRVAMEALEQRLKEMEVMREHMASLVDLSGVDFKLTNGSLVSSFLATFGLLNREQPPVARYVPQDFAYPMPLVGCNLEHPVIIFKD